MRELTRDIADPLLVEVGMGTGGNVRFLSERFRCVGIDVERDAVELARTRAGAGTYLLGDALTEHAHHVADADVVLLLDVLEHIEGDRAFLSGLIGRMKPGANLIMTVPADPRLWSPHDASHHHFRRYTTTTLQQVWRDLPIRPRLLTPFNTRLFPLIFLARTISQRRGRALGQASSDLTMPVAWVNRTLEAVFYGESARIRRVLHGQAAPYPRGVSLMAVLQRSE